MVEHDGLTYKAVMSGDGLKVTRKGARRGVTLTWDDILTKDEAPEAHAASVRQEQSTPRLGMQDVVAADVLLLMRKANDVLAEATRLIDSAANLPSLIASYRQPPEPTESERSDWYIEPLLSTQAVSRLLGVTTRKVRNLRIQKIQIEGEVRYHPAEIRRYLALQRK